MNNHKFVAGTDGFCHRCGDHEATHVGYVAPEDVIARQAEQIERLRALLQDARDYPGDPYVAERIDAALAEGK